jgi:hypothetical protein
LSSITRSNIPGPYFFAPLNIMCSKKCDSPVRPGQAGTLVAGTDPMKEVECHVRDGMVLENEQLHPIGELVGLDIKLLGGSRLSGNAQRHQNHHDREQVYLFHATSAAAICIREH